MMHRKHVDEEEEEVCVIASKCYRLWQNQAEVADDKTAEISLNSIQV